MYSGCSEQTTYAISSAPLSYQHEQPADDGKVFHEQNAVVAEVWIRICIPKIVYDKCNGYPIQKQHYCTEGGSVTKKHHKPT